MFSPTFQNQLQDVTNPHGEGSTAKKISNVIRFYPLSGILKKKFYDLGLPMVTDIHR